MDGRTSTTAIGGTNLPSVAFPLKMQGAAVIATLFSTWTAISTDSNRNSEVLVNAHCNGYPTIKEIRCTLEVQVFMNNSDSSLYSPPAPLLDETFSFARTSEAVRISTILCRLPFITFSRESQVLSSSW